MYKQLHAYSLPYGLSKVAVSQKNLVACAVANTVQVSFFAYLYLHRFSKTCTWAHAISPT